MGREGLATRDTNAVLFDNWVVTDTFRRQVHRRHYEVQDHMGTARVVITDVKRVPSANHFQWGIEAAVETYPFGMAHPRRNGGSYRYGWQGMERDTSGSAGGYVTLLREYDARLGRWLSTDPVTQPAFSPYVAMNNNPLNIVDPTGAKGGGPGDEEGGSPGPDGSGSTPLDPIEGEQKGPDGSSVKWYFGRDEHGISGADITYTMPSGVTITESFGPNMQTGELRRISFEVGEAGPNGSTINNYHYEETDETGANGPSIQTPLAQRIQFAIAKHAVGYFGHDLSDFIDGLGDETMHNQTFGAWTPKYEPWPSRPQRAYYLGRFVADIISLIESPLLVASGGSAVIGGLTMAVVGSPTGVGIVVGGGTAIAGGATIVYGWQLGVFAASNINGNANKAFSSKNLSALPSSNTSPKIGHPTPWSQMSQAQRNALKHSYTRHAKELGLPNWRESMASELQQKFNAVVGYIRQQWTQLFGPVKQLWIGNSVVVNFSFLKSKE